MLPPPQAMLRRGAQLASSSCLRRSPASVLSTSHSIRSISHTARRGAAHAEEHGHEDTYDPPTGWLWGIRPGEKYKPEGWENLWYYGFFGGFAFLVVGYAFKPDTSIQTWALEEARRRLEAEGILKEPADEESN